MTTSHEPALRELEAEVRRLGPIGQVDGLDFIGGVYGKQRIGPVPRIAALLSDDAGSEGSPWRLMELAWGIIANAGGGDWSKESPEWQDAAQRWRDQFHDLLGKLTGETDPPE